MHESLPHNELLMTRRRVIAALGGVGVALATAGVAAAAPSSKSKTAKLKTTTTKAAAAVTSLAATLGGTTACTLTPEVTEGPYYIDLNNVRTDITEGKAGTPLTLRLTVADATGCVPIKGAAVDIWHCDPGGSYSGFTAQSAAGNGAGGGAGAGLGNLTPPAGARPTGAGAAGGPPPGGGPGGGGGGPTDKLTFLRGTQLTDAGGVVVFKTVYPGWYHGRTVHIHVKVHAGGKQVHTGQLFFGDALTDKVFTVEPYKSKGVRDVRNAGDGIYNQGGGKVNELKVSSSGAGYLASMIMGVKRA